MYHKSYSVIVYLIIIVITIIRVVTIDHYRYAMGHRLYQWRRSLSVKGWGGVWAIVSTIIYIAELQNCYTDKDVSNENIKKLASGKRRLHSRV